MSNKTEAGPVPHEVELRLGPQEVVFRFGTEAETARFHAAYTAHPPAQEQPAPAWWVRDSEPPHFYAPAFHKGPQPPAPLTEAEARAAGWRPFYATHPTPAAQEQPAPYFNRAAVERAISTAENPAPGTMQLNDGKERVTLPGGTLRRMLAIIDQLATHPTPAERATLKGQP